MIGGHVCGFEPDAVIVPIAIDDRPKVFNLSWVYSVVNYLLNTVTSLHVLLKYHTPSIESALAIKIPYRYCNRSTCFLWKSLSVILPKELMMQ